MPKKMIHTLEELKDLQALPLDFKVAMTRDRITEFYERMDGELPPPFMVAVVHTSPRDMRLQFFETQEQCMAMKQEITNTYLIGRNV